MANKYLDKDGLILYDGLIKAKVANKVEKVDGKGLSKNDFTDTARDNVAENTANRHNHSNKATLDGTTASYTQEEKTKLAGLENYNLPTASANQKGGVMVGAGLEINNGVLSATGGGTADSVDWSNVQNKPTIPTNNSQLANGAGYQNSEQVESAITNKGYQNSTQVENAITSKGYQTASDVNTAITNKGYQTSAQVNSIIDGKGYQTAEQIDNKIGTAIASTYKASGSIAFASLPTPAQSNLGNVYNITNDFTTNASFVEGAGKTYSAGANIAIVKVGNDYKYDVMSSFIDTSNFVTTSDYEAIPTTEIEALFND